MVATAGAGRSLQGSINLATNSSAFAMTLATASQRRLSVLNGALTRSTSGTTLATAPPLVEAAAAAAAARAAVEPRLLTLDQLRQFVRSANYLDPRSGPPK